MRAAWPRMGAEAAISGHTQEEWPVHCMVRHALWKHYLRGKSPLVDAQPGFCMDVLEQLWQMGWDKRFCFLCSNTNKWGGPTSSPCILCYSKEHQTADKLNIVLPSLLPLFIYKHVLHLNFAQSWKGNQFCGHIDASKKVNTRLLLIIHYRPFYLYVWGQKQAYVNVKTISWIFSPKENNDERKLAPPTPRPIPQPLLAH